MVYVTEGDSVFLEAQVVPTDDNTLTYEWLLNGRPLMKAHRFVLSHDFGFIALNILYMYPEDSGTYTLIVRNASGEAQSTMDIDCAVKGKMITESFHPNSIQRIRELEMPLQPPDERPEAPRMAPQIVRPLPPHMESVHESQTLHLEAQILPIDDNKLKVEWLHNGSPLKASSRYRLMNDFGFVSLDIDFIIAEDAGTYTLVIINPEGRAETSTQFDVIRLQSVLADTSHPESLRRIQEIEAMQPAKPEEEDYVPEKPVFTQQLSGPSEILKEGQSVHMDCMVQPINDPRLKIEWFLNGHPILFGSRIRTIHDFGYVGLEFLHVHPEDTGTYTCKASNAAGVATTEFTFECKPRRNIYLDTQHAESWARIQEIENREEIRPPSPDQTFPPPTFTQPLQNVEGLVEGESTRLECRLQPVNDPTLRVYWTKNGQPIPEGSRFMPARNFDYVNLDLLAVYGEDSGVYSCRAVSEFGEATTSCTVKCQPTDALLLNTQHQESWNQIQDIENRRPEEPIYEEPEKVPPRFVVPLPSTLGEFQEGSPVHFEGQIEPTNDNRLTVHWYHDGQPLVNAHRFRTTHDFGYVSLDILYAFPEDSGEWICLVRNELGEAKSAASFKVTGRGVILGETQHPESWQRIQQIEAPKAQAPEAPELRHGPPKFTEAMNSAERIEGQPVHFETRVTPVQDPKMRIQWYKDGAPLHSSNRFHHTSDFGFVGLDIAYTIPEDAGIYTVVATNEQGEDRTDAQLTVQSRSAILGDSQNVTSWEKIQIMEQPKEKVEAEPEAAHGPPHFTSQLSSVTDLIEGQPAHFEATFEPINDPRMAIVWYHNGRPLAASSRTTMRSDFGLVTLDIHYVLPEDIGEFKCIATNNFGEDATSATLQCQPRAGILADVQHVESWKRIQEIEAPKAAPAPLEPTIYAKPTFTQPLQSVADVPEGGIALLQARVIPVNDPNLQILWFHNDAPLMQSNWYTMSNDFGCVSLRIAPVYPHHSGVYSCKAVNQQGAAITSASLSVLGEDSLQLNTQHPDSLQKIQQLESLDKFPRLEAPEKEFGKPNWVYSFDNIDNLQEGEIVHLSGNVEPSGDPNLRIEWFLNGAPLMNSNRHRQENDFGNVTLTIVHVLPQDSGIYTCKATNRAGEASTSATVKVAGYEAIVRNTQHPVSWEKIQILETPAIAEEVEEVIEKEKPRFLSQLESFTDIPEGEVIHLEATFQPARDPDLKVIWLRNGQPLGASQLIKTRSELGWAVLDINGVNLDHNGIYTLKIINSEGEAASSASIKVAGVGDVLTNTSHEESWRRIQEIEAPKEKSPEAPPPVYEAPTIQTQITDVECNEGEPSHFEAVVAPTNDPHLAAIWYRNGQPLAHGSKYAISQDFGFCTLDIGHTIPEDQGVYQLRVTNESGEAVSSATLKCHGKDAILGDTQHEESWRRIQEIEAPKAPAPELAPAPKMPPKFITSIQNISDLYEGQPAHFEATVEPIDDPDLKIHWYLNGAPVTASSRVKMISDFGWIILDINQTEPRDTGEWTCVATNSTGEAKCSAKVNVLSRENIVFDSIQPQSLERIREIEAPKPLPAEAPAKVYGAPQITVQLQSPSGLSEGDSAHLEAQFTPVDDPHLKVEWFRNGQPLFHANRYKMVQDFGFAILDILHLFAADAGEYTMKVSNAAGQASTSATLGIATKESLILLPQDEGKARAVQQLEDALHRKPEEVIVEEKRTVPVFIEPLSAPVSCEEGDRVHFSARYEPVNDNQLQIQWFLNGKLLKIGSRVKSINDFGFVVLEISPTYPEDSGEYTCRAFNKIGEAVTSTQLNCTPKQKIITNSQLPERMSGAYRRIKEIETPKPPAPERPDVVHGPPRFVTQLQSLPELIEGQVAHLEAQVEPVADPHLKIEWFHNGKPVGHTSRMKNIHDFGFVVMELSPAEPQDSGTWMCKATNQHGHAETSCDIQVKGMSGISYDWISPAERKERITQLEEWIHRPKEDLEQPQKEYEAPHFTQNLEDLGQMNEADATAFTCVLEPIGDPSLRIEWQHNGHAVPYSNRIHMTNDFGVATLLIKHLIAQDSGEYKCIARNAKGTAETVGRINVASVVQIESPQVVQPLVDTIEGIPEGDSIHLECRVSPINDPKLCVQWFKNGAPLPEASRFKPSFEFGFVTLDIIYAYPEDNGVYECVVVNDKGEARTKTSINVVPKPSLEFTPQAPGAEMDNIESHLRQHTMSALVLSKKDAYDEAAKRPPEFKAQLTNIGVEEGEYCRFETQLAPVNDPYMKVEWFRDGKPVLIGHRFRSTLDFGFACLDVLYALPDDTGEYTCVATNRYGKAKLSAKLACSGTKHIITDTQLPQGVFVSDVKNLGDQPYWSEQVKAEQGRVKQPPQFTIKPGNAQVVENEPARFECAVVGNPKAKVTWYINGNQAIQGHRYKLHYDGIHYLTISNTRISDAGEIVAVARNSEGEVQASAMLDVFQKKDFRQVKLKPTSFKTIEELQEREIGWQKETLGQLGEAFEHAPRPDQQRLMRVERARSPIEPLESEELMGKFTRPKDDKFYEQLTYVETTRPTFKGVELEPVSLKPGRISKYEPPKEKMESVQLKAIPKTEKPLIPTGAAIPQPSWATDTKLGNVEGRFNRMAEPEKEVNIPARDQVHLKAAKPNPPAEIGHVEIEKDKAKLSAVVQGPEVPKEVNIPAKDQVQIKQKFQPKVIKPSEAPTIESEPLKEIPPVVKGKIAETTITSKHMLFYQTYREHVEQRALEFETVEEREYSKRELESNIQRMHYERGPRWSERVLGYHIIRPQPTKMGQTHKPPPQVTQQLKPVQAEVGRNARFFCSFDGAHPMTVTWFRDGKEIKPSFEFQINTTNTGSTLTISKLKPEYAGEYMCRIENVAGTVESLANLTMLKPVDRGVAPDFKQRISDLRTKQNAPSQFTCVVTGTPQPTATWFKDGKQLPNDGRYKIIVDGDRHSLLLTDTLPQDGGVYECVAKNTAGEARCKARLNIILATTGQGAEAGPRLEAPRFSSQIAPVVAQEGGSAEFRIKYTGSPEPTIRWYRNNEPLKKSKFYTVTQANGEALLRIAECYQEDVAEYKVEAVNPAGKATSIANLVLAPKSGSFRQTIITKATPGVVQPPQPAPKTKLPAGPPQFISKLSDISARPGHTVKFVAEISGDPQPSVAWQFNGRPLYSGRDTKISLVGNKAILEIQRISQANAGDYIITIRNPTGAAQCQAKLNIESR
uniref:Titin n=1 Tax=Ascaris suum TaxID=6253 RepID=F1KPJ7_ASCSU